MTTYIIIYEKQIIGIAKSTSRVIARHLAQMRAIEEGKKLQFCKIQAIEFNDNQVLIF